MQTRRLVFGDWSPVIRDGIDVLRLAILAGAVGFAVAGDLGAAAVLGFLGLVTLVVRLLNLPRIYDLCLSAAMALQGYGEVFGLYDPATTTPSATSSGTASVRCSERPCPSCGRPPGGGRYAASRA